MSKPMDIAIKFANTVEKRLRSVSGNKFTEDSEREKSPLSSAVETVDISSQLEAFMSGEDVKLPHGKNIVSKGIESEERISELSEEAQNLAAVSGWFLQRRLFNADIEEDFQKLALSRLEPLCFFETSGSKVGWNLKQNYRKFILKKLIENNDLQDLLAHREKLPPTDDYGEFLRAILRRKEIKTENLTQDELRTLRTVIQTLEDLNNALAYDQRFPLPRLSDVRQRIERRSFLSDYDILLENGFRGREKELKALNDFLFKRIKTGDYWNGLILTGIGGIGKSTLLAKFVKDVLAEKKATVIILDFDRPGVDAQDSYWLEAEISRQIGQQYEQIDEILRLDRQSARQVKTEVTRTASFAEADSDERFRGSRLYASVISELKRVDAINKPFLLVLDTFEEAAQQGFTGRIFNWLSELGEILPRGTFKVIFSGRLFDYKNQFEGQNLSPSIELNEFEPLLAKQILTDRGLDEKRAEQIANSDYFPRRPLELILLCKIIKDNEETSVAELEEGIKQGGAAAKDLFAGVVYRRVLLRIRDNIVQKIASPGLTLRYITRDLIQKVLAPALELPMIDDERADEILEKLASYEWLATKSKEGEFWHQKELRRTTLKAMLASDPKKCRRISELAAEYFSKGSRKQLAEGVYHRLMLFDDPQDSINLERSMLKMSRDYIGGDIVDLPPPASALLRFITEKKIPLNEIKLLPDKYLEEAYLNTGTALNESREFNEARDLITRGIKTGTALKPDNFGLFTKWEVNTLFATVSWDILIEKLKMQKITDNASLSIIARQFYPAMIVDESLIEDEKVWSAFVKADQKKSLIEKTLDAEGTNYLIRLIMCLIVGHAGKPAGSQPEEAISKLVKRFAEVSSPILSENLSRKIMFLELLAGMDKIYNSALTSAHFKLDPKWLAKLQENEYVTDRKTADLINKTQKSILVEPAQEKRQTVRQLLADIDENNSTKEQNNYQILPMSSLTNEFILEFLRGSDPEFRDPCRYALLEAYPDRESYKRLGNLIAKVINLDLEDLEPDNFVNILSSNAEHGLEIYVEFIDRQWKLGELLQRACNDRPKAEKLWRVAEAYGRWNGAIDFVCRKFKNK